MPRSSPAGAAPAAPEATDTERAAARHRHQQRMSALTQQQPHLAISRGGAMRYAEPWLDSVGAGPALLIAPALLLCACAPDRRGRHHHAGAEAAGGACRKCGGARLPLYPSPDGKFGTVRCYPSAAPLLGAPLRAGTVRVSSSYSTSSSRPSILPDFHRPERRPDDREPDTLSRRRPRHVAKNASTTSGGTIGRKSILECDINPYELMAASEATSGPNKDSGITLVNGQRIRVRPTLPFHRQYDRAEAGKGETSKKDIPPSPTTKIPLKFEIAQKSQSVTRVKSPIQFQTNPTNVRPKTPTTPKNPNYKSILKKSPLPYENVNSSASTGSVRLRKDARHISRQTKKTCHFYVRTPSRKRVQFMVENVDDDDYDDYAEGFSSFESKSESDSGNSSVYDEVEDPENFRKGKEERSGEVEACDEIEKEEPQQHPPRRDVWATAPVVALHRSNSDRASSNRDKATFFDTMALRSRKKSDSILHLAGKDPERLDGLTATRTRKSSLLGRARPNAPPPPPPPPKLVENGGGGDGEPEMSSTCPAPDENIEKETRGPNEISKMSGEDDTDRRTASVTRESALENTKAETPASPSESSQAGDATEEAPPSAPPRKRSGNRPHFVPPEVGRVVVESAAGGRNKTVLQINSPDPPVHRIQIKNEFPGAPATVNIVGAAVSISETPQRKTSILINGDDCYSTVNVNDDVPLYQSSVVVNESPKSQGGVGVVASKSSSKIYIGGPEAETARAAAEADGKPPSALLRELLSDPVEAVRRNLVPHVCGKAEVSRRPKPFPSRSPSDSPSESALLEPDCDPPERDKYENVSGDDVSSEHSSSAPYELMDAGSDCYTDHSNRSSVTEDELANRTKFYELLAEAAAQIEVSESEDHHYESIKTNSDPIYEEIEIPPPLPANPPPATLLDDLKLDKEYTTRSIFEGASKYDILSYLVDAKERGIVQEEGYGYYTSASTNDDDGTKDTYNGLRAGTVSDSSEDNSLVISASLPDEKAAGCQKAAEVERNDSGVGSETSKSSLSKYRANKAETAAASVCEDCDGPVEPPSKENNESEPLICRKCSKRRAERKEIIMEIVETEEKYGKDLQIILEEFYRPMLVAGLLSPEQLGAIFLNAEELLENAQALAERLRDAVEIAQEQGDDDLLTADIGRVFLEAAPMLHAFEAYCVRQSAAALLLAGLEKDKELLRIFLRVSQMENALLRRMNLNSFLMVPVQRVTKYPLLLARLHKATPPHQAGARERLREAQRQVEARLAHMNAAAKDAPAGRLWRRIGGGGGGGGGGASCRRPSVEVDLASIKLRKLAVDALDWNHEEARFALEGRLLFTQPADGGGWRRGRTIKLAPVAALLVVQGGGGGGGNKGGGAAGQTADDGLVFHKSSGARDAALLLVRDKGGRHSLLREPLFLDRCVIAADPAWRAYFEVHELVTRDTFIFKAEDEQHTHTWYRKLQFYAQGMGTWRKRRNALANIMINGMGLRT